MYKPETVNYALVRIGTLFLTGLNRVNKGFYSFVCFILSLLSLGGYAPVESSRKIDLKQKIVVLLG